MPLLKFPKVSAILHPSLLAVLTWSTVAFLYSLHLSNVLLYTSQDVLNVFLIIVLPILIVSFVYNILRTRIPGRPDGSTRRPAPPIQIIRRRLFQCVILWTILTVFEVIVSGGVPLQWLIVGNGRSDFEYGVSSLHGLVNGLMLAIAATYWMLYLYTSRRRFLFFPVLAAIWCIVMVSRGFLLVLMLECIVIYLRLRPLKGSTMVRLVAIGLVALLLFGYVGDARSGAEAFRAVAQPTEAFPDWAPSGLLWAYIYITTPLNNLIFTMHSRAPSYDILLPATASTLFPTVLRNLVYGVALAQDLRSGDLPNEALNASTAYIGPYQDMGIYGIVGFSVIACLLCEIFWHRSGFWNIFLLAVFTQALVLSLFFNMLISLPILGQIFWFYYFCRIPKRAAGTSRTPHAIAVPA